MKVELDTTELGFIKAAVENSTIQGKDSPLVAKVLAKISGALTKEIGKEEKKNGDVGKGS